MAKGLNSGCVCAARRAQPAAPVSDACLFDLQCVKLSFALLRHAGVYGARAEPISSSKAMVNCWPPRLLVAVSFRCRRWETQLSHAFALFRRDLTWFHPSGRLTFANWSPLSPKALTLRPCGARTGGPGPSTPVRRKATVEAKATPMKRRRVTRHSEALGEDLSLTSPGPARALRGPAAGALGAASLGLKRP